MTGLIPIYHGISNHSENYIIFESQLQLTIVELLLEFLGSENCKFLNFSNKLLLWATMRSSATKTRSYNYSFNKEFKTKLGPKNSYGPKKFWRLPHWFEVFKRIAENTISFHYLKRIYFPFFLSSMSF